MEFSEENNESQETSKKAEWALSDLIKKVVLAGSSALFMTEEGVRSFLGDLKLPKDVVQFTVNQVSKTKEDLLKAISKEVRNIFESGSLSSELARLLANVSLEIDAKVRFVVEDEELRPKTDAHLTITKKKRKRKDPS